MSFEQYKTTFAAIAAAKSKVAQVRSWQWYVALAVICLILGLAPQFSVTRIPAFTIYAVLLVCWASSKPLAKRSQEKCLKRVYAEEQTNLNDQSLMIDAAGITCNRGDGQATSHFTWKAFTKCIDMPDAFIFLPSPNTFVRVPKELLAPTDHLLIQEWNDAIPEGTAS